jgi:Holliday junction resolvase RusA-like endonuclease
MTIGFDVRGVPAPKGSARAMLVGGRPRVIASGSTSNQRALMEWSHAINGAMVAHVRGPRPVFKGKALRVRLTFRMPAPRRWKAGQEEQHTTKPDLDKLVRATLDPMTGIIFDDDSRVACIEAAKHYALRGHEGAYIAVDEI